MAGLRVYPCLCFSAVPEFYALVGNEAADELQSSVGNPARISLALKKCFSRMMNCEKKVFVDQLNMLVKRVSEEGMLSCQIFASCLLASTRSHLWV